MKSHKQYPAFALAILCGGAAISACADGSGPGGPTATMQIVQSVSSFGAVDVLVAGQTALSDVPYGTARSAEVPAGSHHVVIRPAGTTSTAGGALVSFVAGDTTTMLTVDSSSIINPWVLTDTGSVVPADQSKLRVVHFAASEPALDIFRTQPDFPTPVSIMFPFNYQEASPYLQSDPGTWTVLVSSWSGGVPVLSDTLLATGPIEIPAGESRTVVILDGESGGLQHEVITP
jgi:hypothetical protein